MRTPAKPSRLLLAAAILHLVGVVTIFVLGHYGAFPHVFDRNGIAVGVASDSIKVRSEAARRSEELIHGELRHWLQANSPFYVRLYSICFATFGVVFGANVLSAEPFNVLCYLAILILVFYLAREIYDRSAGLIAATAVAVWPSFLLHTTQLLKDPLFIAGMLAFMLVSVRLLTRDFSWRSAVVTAISGGLAAAFVWFSRDTMGEILIAIVLVACVLLLIRLFVERRAHAWQRRIPALAGLLLMTALTFGVTQLIPTFERSFGNAQSASSTNPDGWNSSRPRKQDMLTKPQENAPNNLLTRAIARIANLRQGFTIEFSDAGSNIDTEVQIRSPSDLVRYLPRATMIGYLAPFPNMWLANGNQVSRGGRLISGMEMIVTYLIEALAVVGLWHGRRRFSLWLLWIVSAMALVSLGLVVLNIGALYRLRYVFVILLVILATGGAKRLFEWSRKKKTSQTLAH